jgi:hypothetical protein
MNLPSTITMTTANNPAPDPGVVPLPPAPPPSEPQTPPRIQDPILPGKHEPVRDPSPSAPTSQG